MMKSFCRLILLFIFSELVVCAVIQNRKKNYNNEFPELGGEHQGDIILPFPMTRSGNAKNAVSVSSMLWPGGVVPYVFHSNISDPRRMQIRKAMSAIEEGTCVRFVPLKNKAHHIEITSISGGGCYSMVGRQSRVGTSQPVNLEYPGCFTKIGTIEHELLHALGLLHEQARPDRDNYITIKWQNIEKGDSGENKKEMKQIGAVEWVDGFEKVVSTQHVVYKGEHLSDLQVVHFEKALPVHWPDFYKAPGDKVSTYGVPYDYKSIMHYPKNAYSKNGKPTIVPNTNPKQEMGQRDGPTINDFLKVRRMYKCPNTP